MSKEYLQHILELQQIAIKGKMAAIRWRRHLRWWLLYFTGFLCFDAYTGSSWAVVIVCVVSAAFTIHENEKAKTNIEYWQVRIDKHQLEINQIKPTIRD